MARDKERDPRTGAELNPTNQWWLSPEQTVYESTETWDEAHAAGYWGTKMDLLPNEDYTVAGVIPDPPPPPEGGVTERRGPGRPPKNE